MSRPRQAYRSLHCKHVSVMTVSPRTGTGQGPGDLKERRAGDRKISTTFSVVGFWMCVGLFVPPPRTPLGRRPTPGLYPKDGSEEDQCRRSFETPGPVTCSLPSPSSTGGRGEDVPRDPTPLNPRTSDSSSRGPPPEPGSRRVGSRGPGPDHPPVHPPVQPPVHLPHPSPSVRSLKESEHVSE